VHKDFRDGCQGLRQHNTPVFYHKEHEELTEEERCLEAATNRKSLLSFLVLATDTAEIIDMKGTIDTTPRKNTLISTENIRIERRK
jgi:hypothetical protein